MGGDYPRIYAAQAADYHRLVMAEDADGALARTLAAVAPLPGARVLEAGAGTGRISALLLAAGAAEVVATEPAPAMRAVARQHLAGFDGSRWQVLDAALPELSLPDAIGDPFDMAVAGWVMGHFRAWFPARWRQRVDASLAAMRARLRPGGALVVIETLTTGSTTPAAPSAGLAEYHAHLERAHGLRREAIRTDYLFDSVQEAVATLTFFFGEALGERIRARGWQRVPECTGVWHGRV